MSGKMLLQAVSRYLCVLFAVLTMHALIASPGQAAHTSVECPPQSGTVTTGGTASINVTDCTTTIGFAGTGAVDGPAFPANGTANLRIAGSQWFLDYSHNGNSATSDMFEFTDGTIAGNTVRVTIAITPSASPITVSPGSLPTMTAGTAFSQSLTATGGAGPYTYALQSGALPVGLSLSSGGVLSGAPTQRGIYTFSVRATDSTAPTAQFADKGYSGTVQSPTLALAAGTGTAIQGVAFSQTLNTIGGVAPYSYLLETGTLPAGITLSSGGILSGTTSVAPGSFPVTIRVTDASTGPGQYFEVENFTLIVAALPSVSIAVSPASVSEDGASNLVYTVTRSVTSASAFTVNLTTGGTASSASDYTGSVSSITIPANTASATVTINPTADVFVESNESVILTVAAGSGYTVGSPASATGTITNDDAATGPISPFCATQSLTVTNGGSVVSGNLANCDGPLNIGMVPAAAAPPLNGLIVVSPRSGPGNQTVTYTHNGNSATSETFGLEDENGAILTFNVTISPPTSSIVVSPASLPSLVAGTAVSQTLTATGGTAPYTYSVDGGVLPPGLILSSAGLLSGASTARGGYSFSVRVQDSVGAFTSKGYSGTVANPSLSLAANTGTAIQTVPFSQTLVTNGGVAPYVYALETGSWPTGISLSPSGVISGNTTAAPGDFPVTIRVTDASTGAGQYFEVEPFTLTVSPPPSISIAVSPATLTEDGAGNATFTVTRSLNLTSPTTVNLTTAGTATAGTDYIGAVATVTILAGATTATLTIDPTVDNTIEPDETVTLIVAAGTGYTVGTPANATTTILNDDVSTISITVGPTSVAEDDAPNMIYTVTLNSPPSSAISVGYTIGGTATNGTDYATITSPLVIPAGSTTGTITVDPNVDATIESDETVVLTLTAGTGYTVGAPNAATGTIANDDTPTVSIAVSPASISEDGATNATFTVTRSTSLLSATTVNVALTGTAVSGSDFTGGLTSVVIPSGATSATFTIDPTADGSVEANETVIYSIAAGADYTIGAPASATLTIANDDVPVTIAPNTLPAGGVGTNYNQTLMASGGTGPYGYSLTAGTLPTGLTLGSGGVLSGTPIAAGNFNFTVTSTDSSAAPGPYSGSQAYTVTIAAPTIVLAPSTLPNATFGVPYSQNVAASGSVGPYSFAVTSGTLPQGITLAANGTLAGTPTRGGLTSFTVTATDATPTGYAGARAYTFTVNVLTLVLPPTTLPAGGTDIAYTTQIASATGGVAPYTYAVTSGELPYGLTMSPSGAITGTPSTANLFGFVVTATDSNAGTGPSVIQQSYSINITNTPPVANPVSATIPYAAALTPITLNVSGRTSAVSVVTQPTHGRAVASGMTISYIPDTGYSGPDSFTYSASNFDASSAAATVTITVTDPAITVTPVGPLTATVGSPYSQTFTFNGGTQPWSNYQITGLPSGLQTGSSGGNTVEIVGIPTGAGSFPLTISATDASTGNGPFTVSRSVTLNVNGPNLVLTPGSGGFSVGYGAPLSQSIVASGGAGGYSYAVTTGALPTGITLNSTTGLLSGRTTSVGSSSFTITATDNGASGAGAPFVVSGSYVLTVSPPVISFDQTSLPAATVALPYSQTITASGGLAPYSLAVTAGALPAGVNLSGGGVLSGTPTAGGGFTFTVTATDASGAPGPFSAARQFTLSVSAPVVVLPTTGLASGQAGTAYSAALNPATGGIAPYIYAVTGGSLPAGIVLSSSGTLSGLPTAFGSFAFSVTATDSSTGAGPYNAVQGYTLVIAQATPVANSVSVTVAYGSGNTLIPLNLSGGAASSVTVASAPANGTASVSGTNISYQPNASFSGTDSFTYAATNGGGTSAPATVTITVGAPALTITASGPLSATVGANYNQTFSFAGGTAPFGSHQVTGLPAGLALTGTTANSVTISGTPRSQGTFALSVSASDSSTGNGPFVASQSFTLTVAAPNLVIAPASGSFSSSYATAFSQNFTASGGVGPYSYALGGSLPAGLTLNAASGTVSGTSTSTGSFTFNVTATDTGASGAGAPFNVRGSYTLAVAAPTIAVTPATIATAIAGTAYSVALAGSGAVAPYSFSLGGGTLPTGITLSATGVLSGTPTASGSFPFSVTVRDTNGQTGTASLTLVVNVPTITITPATLPVAIQGIAYSQTFTASGGIAPYRFAVSTGSLPAGLALNTTTGVINGTPTASGTANFAITASDSTSGTAASVTVTYALQVTARPDPANDPEVRGLVQAQTMATRRFADAQVNNFMRRLEGLHGRSSSGGGFQNGLRFATPGYCQDSVTAWTNGLCAKSESELGSVSSANAGETSGNGTGAAGGSDDTPWTIWAGGSIRFGDRDPATGRLSQKFESEGITFGGDYQFSPSFAAGLGVGLGRDTVDIGKEGSRSQGEAKTVAIYGSHQLGSGIYFDWLGGYQTLDFDLRRYVTPTGRLVNSSRSGRQWFGTVSTGADIETGNWLITPYARIDLTRGRLNGYTENSGSVFDLAFLDQDVDFTALGLGTRVNYRHIFKGGALLPRLRIEYQYDLERNAHARVAYFDLVSGPFSTIPLTGLAREQLIFGVGAELQLQSALALEFEYLNRSASGSGSDQSVQVGLKYKF